MKGGCILDKFQGYTKRIVKNQISLTELTSKSVLFIRALVREQKLMEEKNGKIQTQKKKKA